MKVPNRAPDFQKEYSDEQSFIAARSKNDEIASVMENHKSEITPSTLTRLNDSESLQEVLKQEKTLPATLSARRLSEKILLNTQPKIVPSCHGRIENLLVTIPWYRSGGQISYLDKDRRHFESLYRLLGDNRKYTVLCHPLHKKAIDDWFPNLQNLSKIYCLSPRFAYSIWAQDAYIALRSGACDSVLTEGVLFPRYDDMTIADDVALQSDIKVWPSTLYFQGGNILGGPDYTLIGEDYIFKNETRYGTETRDKVIDAFQALFGTDIVPLGGCNSAAYDLLDNGVFSGLGFQPLFHIDMYVTPTGVTGTSGKEIILLGRPSKAYDAIGRYSEEEIYNNPNLDRYFDETEEQLSDRFEVQHLPLLPTYGNLNLSDEDKRYYWLTFNNVVIENFGSERNVLMTTYSQDYVEYRTDPVIRRDLEQAAKEVWKRVGYKVHCTDGLEDLAHGSGSIHCITKAVSRSSWVM